MSNHYETVFILNPVLSEEQIKEEYYNINVEFSDARSETEQIQIMLKNILNKKEGEL